MKKLKKRVLASFLVVLMVCSALVFEPMQTKAATTYTVTSLDELKTALEKAVDGDVINVGQFGEYSNIIINEPIEIKKDLTINIYGSVDYMQSSEKLPEALVVINSCDVTLGGYNFSTGCNDVYGYKLVDETDDASLIIDCDNMLDEGILIVDDASNDYTSKVTINSGYYYIPAGRETAFTFSNGTTTTEVPKANLLINGGSYTEDISEYLGENTEIVDNGEEYSDRYEVRSTIMSDQFKSMLTDGKIIVPSAEPKTEEAEYAYLMGYLCLFETEDVYYYPGRVRDGVYDIAGWMEKEPYDLVEVHRVEVEFSGDIDESALDLAEDVVDNIPYESEYSTWEDENGVHTYEYRYSPFLISDMETVNMWANKYDRNNLTAHRHTANYSGELKEYLGNSNVDFRVTMIGAGLDTDLYLEACGDAVILVNGKMCASVPYSTRAQVQHVVYVPDGTPTDKDSLLTAAQKRINEYLGSDSKVVVSYGGAFNTLSSEWYDSDEEYYAEMLKGLGLESAPENYFVATSGDMQYKFVIIPDSSKMIAPTYKTVDVSSNVVISSDSAEIPLDTSMRANQLTSGEEYDKVIETLGVEENVTFDLKLYSQSTASYVSKLETGKFEVQIPITETLKDKDLVAYYVDENGKVVEYEITVKDGCAVFATDHFSIYTIAEKTVVVPPTPPTPEVVAPEDNAGGSTFEEKAETVVEKVPFTEEEKAQIEAGAEVKITLDVKDITETVSKEDKVKVEAEVEKVEDQTVGMYLDVNIFKQVGTNEAVKVPELNGKVKIQFTVPDTLLVKDEKMNREYSVIRVHDGVTTILDAKFDAETKTLAFETDHFSTYALVYKDVPKTPVSETPDTETPDTEIPDTGDHTFLFAWLVLLAIGGCAITFGLKTKRQY